MAEYKTTVALEIGAQSVVMAVFSPAGRGFALSRYARKEILLDPVEEGMRIDYVSHAIGELVKELKVRGKDVRDVVSGQKVFMRFIKLPALDTVEDLEEQVGYEARQHIPFPPEDIIYSYQKLGGAEDGEQEVLLVAIKKDELDDLNGQVEANGLNTKSVDCSITSLYNAFCASYPEEEEPVMLLDIGAKTTDIIFAESGRFFTRSVTAAGAYVTNSIAREFNVSFREAEQMKLEQGAISLGNGHTDSMSETEASLASIIRNAVTRLSSEVQRTINHYRAQYKGSAPAKAYICGGGARLPFMVEFLQSSLGIPVEFLNPLKSLTLGAKVNTEELEMDALCLGPVVGAAVSGAKAGVFNIDLVPTSVGKDRAEKKLIPLVLTAGAIALLGAGFFSYTAHQKLSEAQRVLSQAEPELRKLENLHSTIQHNTSKYDRNMKFLRRCGELYAARTAYADIFMQLAEKTASTTFWFSDFDALINYDVRSTIVSDAQSGDRNTTTLINTVKSRTAADSAINPAPEPVDAKDRNKAPRVTAIRLRGYIFKKSAGKNSMPLLDELVSAQFNESHPESLFSIQSKDVTKNMNNYFMVQDSKASKGNNIIPDYVDQFYLVMPLKTPLAIPELSGDKK
ncbi:MAG: type IV pilus assembly protein PilM [Akkermansiaceae bacterium]|nr:type IV pilus assembly protein PilM [Akkermansiaceae bacterium]